MIQLGPEDWYVLAGLAMVTSWVVFRVAIWTYNEVARWLSPFLRRNLLYRTIGTGRFGVLSIRWLEAIIGVLFIVANVIPLTFRLKTEEVVSVRGGRLGTVNFVLLLVYTNISFAVRLLGLSRQSQAATHRWVGFVAVSEAAVHSIIKGINTHASSSIVLAAVVATIGLRRRFYETFSWTHYITATVTTITLYLHLKASRIRAHLYLLGGVAAWAGLTVLNFLIDCYYNLNLGRGHWLPRAKIFTVYNTKDEDQIVLTDACYLEVRLRRSWKIKAGQYVYVRIPALSLLSVLQSRPFWVVWWEHDRETNTLQLDILVRRRGSFSRRLLSDRDQERIAWISRPFGRSEPFGDYGTVLMFATDIGIAAQLAYLKEIMQGRVDATIRTRRVLLVWQIKQSNHNKWAKKWLDKMLPNDTSFMMEIEVYSPGDGQYQPVDGSYFPMALSPGKVLFAGEHEMIKLIARPPHLKQIIEAEIKRPHRGRMIVSSCVGRRSGEIIRNAVVQHMDRDVKYHEHEFEVPENTMRTMTLD